MRAGPRTAGSAAGSSSGPGWQRRACSRWARRPGRHSRGPRSGRRAPTGRSARPTRTASACPRASARASSPELGCRSRTRLTVAALPRRRLHLQAQGRWLDPGLQLGGSRRPGRGLGRAVRRRRDDPERVPDPLRHLDQLRRRRHALGHLALVRGGRQRASSGNATRAGRTRRSRAPRWARSSTRPHASTARAASRTSPRTSARGASTASGPIASATSRRASSRWPSSRRTAGCAGRRFPILRRRRSRPATRSGRDALCAGRRHLVGLGHRLSGDDVGQPDLGLRHRPRADPRPLRPDADQAPAAPQRGQHHRRLEVRRPVRLRGQRRRGSLRHRAHHSGGRSRVRTAEGAEGLALLQADRARSTATRERRPSQR